MISIIFSIKYLWIMAFGIFVKSQRNYITKLLVYLNLIGSDHVDKLRNILLWSNCVEFEEFHGSVYVVSDESLINLHRS